MHSRLLSRIFNRIAYFHLFWCSPCERSNTLIDILIGTEGGGNEEEQEGGSEPSFSEETEINILSPLWFQNALLSKLWVKAS